VSSLFASRRIAILRDLQLVFVVGADDVFQFAGRINGGIKQFVEVYLAGR
jgi:hypothetical protein